MMRLNPQSIPNLLDNSLGIMTDADPSLLIPDRQVVIPPDNVKKYADLTSDRVIKSWSFLDQVRKQHGDKPQLAFIHETHQFFPYFIMRIKYKGEIPSHLIITAEQAAATASATKPTINLAPVAPPPPPRRPLHERLRQIVHKRSLPPPTDDDTIDLPDPPPPSLESIYTVRPPTLYHPQELDIIKLTALYVARNGREFLGQITSYANRDRREMFDFLKTTHPFFPTFQKLVDAYTNVITPPPATLSSLSSDVKDIEAILSNLKLHATYKRREEVRRANSELNEEEERVAMQLIDWHNFIVVQTLTFDPQEVSNPFIPFALGLFSDIKYAVLLNSVLHKVTYVSTAFYLSLPFDTHIHYTRCSAFYSPSLFLLVILLLSFLSRI